MIREKLLELDSERQGDLGEPPATLPRGCGAEFRCYENALVHRLAAQRHGNLGSLLHDDEPRPPLFRRGCDSAVFPPLAGPGGGVGCGWGVGVWEGGGWWGGEYGAEAGNSGGPRGTSLRGRVPGGHPA